MQHAVFFSLTRDAYATGCVKSLKTSTLASGVGNRLSRIKEKILISGCLERKLLEFKSSSTLMAF